MTLSQGTRLGPYQIHGALGAGGMGEVYKALDTRLDRIVAIKVLPEHLSRNEELRKRFDRAACPGPCRPPPSLRRQAAPGWNGGQDAYPGPNP